MTRRDALRRCLLAIGGITLLNESSAAADKQASIDITSFGGDAGKYNRMLQTLKELMISSIRTMTLRGRERRGSHHWLRDQVHVMKGVKYWEKNLTDVLEFFLEQQTPSGMYWDYALPTSRGAVSRIKIFEPRYSQLAEAERRFYQRLPVEADVEYLAVEGVYLVWQVTGDIAWMAKWLPTLKRGLLYSMTDPLRWSKKYQLVKRGYTIDTWDFQHTEHLMGSGDGHKRTIEIFDIDNETPMGIMHGDNSGMYAACVQLAEMYEAAGIPGEAAHWNEQAKGFRERTNRVCWNGDFYAHFIEDDPAPAYPSIDHTRLLSLSNTYDINRGLPTHDMAASIIRTYMRLREETGSQSFAEWYSLYPSIEPHYGGYKPGTYVNGGIITIVAGELAKAAFHHGFEEYGVDILERIAKLIEKHGGKLPVTYRPDGTVDAGIPDDWGQAAVVSALIEGLAGVRDLGAAFSRVEVSPRWLAANIDNASATINYPMGNRTVRYSYNLNKEKRRIVLNLHGDAKSYVVRILMPRKTAVKDVWINMKKVPWKSEKIESSIYTVVNVPKGGKQSIQVEY